MNRQNSLAEVSEDTLFSMQELEPSPVESPTELEFDKRLPDFHPPGAAPTRSFTLGLSGSGHGAVYYLTRLQRYSSYVFTFYTSLHITNTSLIPLATHSVPVSDTYLLLTRPYYQSPLLEPLIVILPLAIHITSGLVMRLYRRNASLTRYGADQMSPGNRLATRTHVWPPLSWGAISGYMLVPLVAGHVFLNRVLPWWVEGGSSGVGLGFVAHGFAKKPFLDTALYFGLIGVASGHVVWGWAKWMGWMPVGMGEGGKRGKAARRRWWFINGVATLVAAVWAAGGLGVVARGGRGTGWVGKGWDDLYSRVPMLGW